MNIKPASIKPSSSGTAVAEKPRYKELATWVDVVKDIALGFMLCVTLTLVYKQAVPGQPIYVGTSSIEKGLYWLDTRVTSFNRNDIVSFNFKPEQLWLQARYDNNHYFTKYVGAVEGDIISADPHGALVACQPASEVSVCKDLGSPMALDSKKRPMVAWLKPGESYTLAPGELWIYAPHPKSLDSRYYGPIQSNTVRGRASPLYTSSGEK